MIITSLCRFFFFLIFFTLFSGLLQFGGMFSAQRMLSMGLILPWGNVGIIFNTCGSTMSGCTIHCICFHCNNNALQSLTLFSWLQIISDVITLSSEGSTLRAWNLPDGQMVWETSLHCAQQSKSLLSVPVSNLST